MKKFLLSVFVLIMIAAFLHGVVWFRNKNLFIARREMAAENRSHHEKTVKEIRVELEVHQKQEIETYGWTNEEEGLARIPVRRAFSYYLRSLPHP